MNFQVGMMTALRSMDVGSEKNNCDEKQIMLCGGISLDETNWEKRDEMVKGCSNIRGMNSSKNT